MIKCEKCDFMHIVDGYWGSDFQCMHESCFMKEEVPYGCHDRALRGVRSYISTKRIRNYSEMNCNNDCEHFIEKRSIFKRIFFRD